jgi:hypothetical protein
MQSRHRDSPYSPKNQDRQPALTVQSTRSSCLKIKPRLINQNFIKILINQNHTNNHPCNSDREKRKWKKLEIKSSSINDRNRKIHQAFFKIWIDYKKIALRDHGEHENIERKREQGGEGKEENER